MYSLITYLISGVIISFAKDSILNRKLISQVVNKIIKVIIPLSLLLLSLSITLNYVLVCWLTGLLLSNGFSFNESMLCIVFLLSLAIILVVRKLKNISFTAKSESVELSKNKYKNIYQAFKSGLNSD